MFLLLAILPVVVARVTHVNLKDGCPLRSFQLPADVEVNSGRSSEINCTLHFMVPEGNYAPEMYEFEYNITRTLHQREPYWCVLLVTNRGVLHQGCADHHPESYRMHINGSRMTVETSFLLPEIRGKTLIVFSLWPIEILPSIDTTRGTVSGIIVTAIIIITVVLFCKFRWTIQDKIAVMRDACCIRNLKAKRSKSSKLTAEIALEDPARHSYPTTSTEPEPLNQCEHRCALERKILLKEFEIKLAQERQLNAEPHTQVTLNFTGPAEKMLNEVGRTSSEFNGPVELMLAHGLWSWEVGHQQRPAARSSWSEALHQPYDRFICSSPPVLMPWSLGGWKLVLILKIESRNVQLRAYLPLDAYNKELLRAAEKNEENLREMSVQVTTRWLSADGSGAPMTSSGAAAAANYGEKLVTSLWDMRCRVVLSTVSLSACCPPHPPIISLQLLQPP